MLNLLLKYADDGFYQKKFITDKDKEEYLTAKEDLVKLITKLNSINVEELDECLMNMSEINSYYGEDECYSLDVKSIFPEEFNKMFSLISLIESMKGVTNG